MARVQARAKHVENYSCGTIFVRKITKDHTDRDIEQVVNDVSIVFVWSLRHFAIKGKGNGRNVTRHIELISASLSRFDR